MESQPHDLKPEQAAAAHTLNRHLSVTAGPGSGKTTVLVERYLEILRRQNVSVDNIVAITFTNRAANEMRERVRAKIDEVLRAAAGDERRRWLRHKRALEGAVITTIHGFCSRLLHEFPVEANIDPQFVLLDEHQAAMMLEAVVDEALSEAIHHGNDRIVQLAQAVGGRGSLARVLVDFYMDYRGEGLSLAEIREQTSPNHAGQRDYTAAFAALEARIQALFAIRVSTPGARLKRARLEEAWPALRAIVAQPPTEKTIAKYTQAIEDFYDFRPQKRGNEADAVTAIDEMLWGANSKSDDRLAGKLPGIGFDLLARNYAAAVLNLMHEIERRLDEEKQRLSVVDFDDLQLRTLKLVNEHPEVLSSLMGRYRFFLVDEFQDTNGLQRDLMKALALASGANLFIVGDRKQSVYGFRGADVDVFREMTEAIEAKGGTQQPLHLNFRSQEPLIDGLNFLFANVFHALAEVPTDQLGELGYVPHEASVAARGADHDPPLMEMLVSVLPDGRRPAGDSEDEDDGRTDKYDRRELRERDAAQLVDRIHELVNGSTTNSSLSHKFNYGDIAILFRALTVVGSYESAFRRAGIPYLTVQGKGFYQREEITDLIQLLRFLDNTKDEIALAALLRSPLCGISDNALFALRSAPLVDQALEGGKLPRRELWRATVGHRQIQFIDEAEHVALDRAARFLDAMIRRRSRYSIAELLRIAVNETDFMAVIAANFDGAQRITNVEKLFRLAETFEKSGQLISDFVNYVKEFEDVGGRESEGQMDKTANVVRLMTIHQAKGLEFPVVIIPDMHRAQSQRDGGPFVLDRHRGFTVSVPDGRGLAVRGALFKELRQRAAWREEFESMRLLYVAATRAKDRLIFSGATSQREMKNLKETTREQWLAWLWQAFDLAEQEQSRIVELDDGVRVALRVSSDPAEKPLAGTTANEAEPKLINPAQPIEKVFPLLRAVDVVRGESLRRFSVTQLINFQRCTRQYYFDRLLHTPGAEELAAWNDAEVPEPPANLTATLKGAVIHRFCETFVEGDDVRTRLRQSFEQVLSQRQAELAGRVFEIDVDTAVRDLLPLAQNYLASEVFQRVMSLQRLGANSQPAIRNPKSSAGVWSELRFRLRRPLGILTGTIDKLLIQPSARAEGFDVEIIDFKTNRFRAGKLAAYLSLPALRGPGDEDRERPNPTPIPSPRAESGGRAAQASFDFEKAIEEPSMSTGMRIHSSSSAETSLEIQIDNTARDYRLQMQSYALALRELLPADVRINSLRATLHFIDPNVESTLTDEQLESEACAAAIDDAMSRIATLDGTLNAGLFPPLPATHCRMCNFLDLCPAGRDWLESQP